MSWADRADRMLGVAVRTFAASSVQYIPKSGTPYLIDAVFDKAHLEIDQDTGAAISSSDPVLGVQLSQMQAPIRKGDRARVTSKGVTTLYDVVDVQPDGVAGARLKLHEA